MNFEIEVYNKISKNSRNRYMLYIDAIYKSDPKKRNMSGEVLSKLLGVKNQGGFRYLGKTKDPKMVVLYSTGEDVYWRDEIDNRIGVFLYYGDNNTPGNDLHKTNLHGNEILRDVFALASSEKIEDRRKIPPILVFKKASGRDVKFLGLAVPGIKGKPSKDWLTAVWGRNKEGDRFQNYKALFTILNTSSGSFAERGNGINLAWLNDIEEGKAVDSQYAPKEWVRYIENEIYTPLIAKQDKFIKSREEQLPKESEKKRMLKNLHDYFLEKDKGYSFEGFASYLLECMDDAIEDIEVTRPFKDGGFDAVGRYRIFRGVENTISVDFYMQAKCYSEKNGIGVPDTARLISRIKNRQFGILVTTSYIARQAYKEILEDGHPIVIINGNDIIEYIYNEFEIRSVEELLNWLKRKYD